MKRGRSPRRPSRFTRRGSGSSSCGRSSTGADTTWRSTSARDSSGCSANGPLATERSSSCAASRYTPNGYVRTTYAASEIDAVAAYCAEIDRCFLVPVDDLDGRGFMHLRLGPTRNG